MCSKEGRDEKRTVCISRSTTPSGLWDPKQREKWNRGLCVVTRYHLGTVLRVQEGPTHKGRDTGLRPPREPGGDSRALPLPAFPGRHVWEKESRRSRPRDTKKERRPPICIPAASHPGRTCQPNPHGRLRILEGTRMPHSRAWMSTQAKSSHLWRVSFYFINNVPNGNNSKMLKENFQAA